MLGLQLGDQRLRRRDRLRVRGGEGDLVTFEPAQRLRLSRLEELTW